jgi:hypothetical protein
MITLLSLLLPAQAATKTFSLRMPVTYVSAVTQMSACLRGQGWVVKQTIPLGRKNDRTLINFQNGKQKITVMLWRIDLAKTGFSWGIVE